MRFDGDKLLTLLPAIYRLRDDGTLADLLRVFGGEIGALEENLEQLYDDQFIETCAPWVVPYIGALVGCTPASRGEVANALRHRRRKGTAAMLEQLAFDVTGWPARAVEFFERLAVAQYMNHTRVPGPANAHAPATANLRDWEACASRDTAFDRLSHMADVRRVSRGVGRYNIPNIGIFLWRQRAFALTRVPVAADPANARRYRFNPLDTDIQLFSRHRGVDGRPSLADLPHPLGIRHTKRHFGDYWGSDRSFLVEVAGAGGAVAPFPADKVCICFLGDVLDAAGNPTGAWAHENVATGELAIDPERGRMVFGTAPTTPVLASFHYGFTRDIGGGEYERDSYPFGIAAPRLLAAGAPLQPDLDAIAGGGILEIRDSATHAETPTIRVQAGQTVIVRAGALTRPLIEAAGNIRLLVRANGKLVLEGLVITGGALVLENFPGERADVVLRHCTLVPGAAPALVVRNAAARVTIDRCITGPIQAIQDADVEIKDGIVDAGATTLPAFRGTAGNLDAGANLTTSNTTIVGKVHTRVMKLASNTLFAAALVPAGETWAAPVWAERKQEGCVRFSFVPPGSRTPQRHRCPEQDASGQSIAPRFVSTQYGEAGYCQLADATPREIRCGASDESEIGFAHDLYQPQREATLRLRLEEYLRYGLEAGIFHAT